MTGSLQTVLGIQTFTLVFVIACRSLGDNDLAKIPRTILISHADSSCDIMVHCRNAQRVCRLKKPKPPQTRKFLPPHWAILKTITPFQRLNCSRLLDRNSVALRLNLMARLVGRRSLRSRMRALKRRAAFDTLYSRGMVL